MTEPRIVSLIASATEIVCAPVCSSSKVDVDGSSRAIDDQVRSIVATALGRPERAERLTAEMTGRLDALRDRSGRLAERPTIACIEWIDPLMHAENWVPELVEIAGGSVMLGEAGRHSGYFEFEQMMEADPDVIAVMPCGFDIPRTAAEILVELLHPGVFDFGHRGSGWTEWVGF